VRARAGLLLPGRCVNEGDLLVKRVIFVCVENSNRSQMAQAFAHIHGAGKVEAFSAGSRPSGRINPKAVEAMEKVGYDLTTHTSKGLDEFNDQEFDAAVTMGCGDECPLVHTRRRLEWQIPDPRDMTPDQFRDVRNLIETKVKELIATRNYHATQDREDREARRHQFHPGPEPLYQVGRGHP
jgi:protein-tyrosine-phosphatase